MNTNNSTGTEEELKQIYKKIEQEKQRIAQLRQKAFSLRHEVILLEGYVTSLQDSALTMPEDLGDWQNAPARITGIVQRIKQTHELAVEVDKLSKSS